jgi:Tfp pilus assembly protein PilE
VTAAHRLAARLRREEGQGLVELMIAMMVLTVGILALVGAYSTGYSALSRATTVSSAQVIADSQMERFRALSYPNIQLNSSCGASCTQNATYTADSQYSATNQVTGCTTTDATCLSTQTMTGPDNKSYRVDTYIDYSCPTASGTLNLSTSPQSCGSGQPLAVKLVTVVVRKSTGGTWVREQSTFTAEAGT